MPNIMFNSQQRPAFGPNIAGGMDINKMIQTGAAGTMADIDERRRMGRQKFAQDALQQQTQQTGLEAQNRGVELQNQAAGYHLGQEHQFYEGQGHGTPQGVAFDQTQNQEFMAQDQHELAAAAHILANYVPMPGQAAPPHVLVAQQIVARHGGGGGQAPAAQPAPVAPQAPQIPSRGAVGTFMHEAIPAGVGSGAAAAAMRAPLPPWGKAIAVPAAYMAGDKIGRMVEGPLSQEDAEQHPWAATAGQVTGTALGYLGHKLGTGSNIAPSRGAETLQPNAPVASAGGSAVGNMVETAQPTASTFAPAKGVSQSMPTPGSELPMPAGALPPQAGLSPAQQSIAQRFEAMHGRPPAPQEMADLSKLISSPQGSIGVPAGERGRGPEYAPASQGMESVNLRGSKGSQWPKGEPKTITPSSSPGELGRGIPQHAPGAGFITPSSSGGRQLPGGVDSIANQKMSKFFQLNGRMPNQQELAQLLFGS